MWLPTMLPRSAAAGSPYPSTPAPAASASPIGIANESAPNATAVRRCRANSARSRRHAGREHEVQQPERAQEDERLVALEEPRHARPGHGSQRDEPDEPGNPQPLEQERADEQDPHRDGHDEDGGR